MKVPFIVLVDDDEHVLRALQRDVRSRFQPDYRVLATSSAREALDLIQELQLKSDAVALIISDQRMPEMEGVDFLEKARLVYPDAKQILLTAYSDTDAAIRAINNVRLDYYLLKPWNPPEEKLYPVMMDLLNDWHEVFKPEREGIKVIGFQWSPKSHAIKEFLSGNLVPFTWLDTEVHEEAERYRTSAGVDIADLPMVVIPDGTVLKDPSLTDVATAVGLQLQASATIYDVVIVGGGPAGLAASVYGSSEGLRTLLVEGHNPGGQASSSARIENYLGFPTGLSGAELTRRALTQTLRFGTEVLTSQTVTELRVQDGYKILCLKDGTQITCRAVVLATGVAYRVLDIPGMERFTGAGVYYGAAAIEAHACKGTDIYIVGGGNSACQAAMYMSKFATNVNIIIRQDRLSQAAANYLVEQISKTPNIHIIPHCEVVAVDGDTALEKIDLKDVRSGEVQSIPTKALFVYIGARPGTDWLESVVLRDHRGFIVSGSDLMRDPHYHTFWKLDREPYLPETSVPGIFAAGDVRSGALTGISSAVGEGSMAIRFARKYLQET